MVRMYNSTTVPIPEVSYSPQELTRQRKTDHIQTCVNHAVESAGRTPWFEYVDFVHQAVPQVALPLVDTSVTFLGRPLNAPFLIASMTGGTPQGRAINRHLARIAAELGVGLAVGSQRPMLDEATLATTYQVRDIAPSILLLGNIGIYQAVTMTIAQLRGLMDAIAADGIIIHLNSCQELFQPEGDRSIHSATEALTRFAGELGNRLIVKETGCGISRETAMLLRACGVQTVDVAGAGGTSWVRVETLRKSQDPNGPRSAFENWGIPTAASLLEVRGSGLSTIGSGGIRSGLDLAKAIALGADLGSAALPILRALAEHGEEASKQWISDLCMDLRRVMSLLSCQTLQDLRRVRLIVRGPLYEWVSQSTPSA